MRCANRTDESRAGGRSYCANATFRPEEDQVNPYISQSLAETRMDDFRRLAAVRRAGVAYRPARQGLLARLKLGYGGAPSRPVSPAIVRS